jgi:phosphoglycolate phosphatase-like HAD superfamily hydrolase
MKFSTVTALSAFPPRHPFLVGVDSDGCAIDSMAIKQKECFIPNIIKYWELEPMGEYARAAAEFVSLHSKWRGINRFPALAKTFELLRDWPEAGRSGVEIPELSSLESWIDSGAALGEPALEAEIAKTGDAVLKRALAWSQAINRDVAALAHRLVPFPSFPACAAKIARRADLICVSVAPTQELEREWQQHGIAQYASLIAGQEMGGKKEQLKLAGKDRYAADSILMVGDAPGDLAAARAAGALFFPIQPGEEERSWQRLERECLDRFFSYTFAGACQASLIEEFEKSLPDTPPWRAGK